MLVAARNEIRPVAMFAFNETFGVRSTVLKPFIIVGAKVTERLTRERGLSDVSSAKSSELSYLFDAANQISLCARHPPDAIPTSFPPN